MTNGKHGVRTFIEGWPVYRQLTGTDPLGRGAAAKSGRSARLDPRTTIREGQTARVHVDLSSLHFFDPETGESLRG